MKTIKTKPVAEGIKALDKAANLSVRAKNAYVRTKKAAVETKQPQNSSPSEYATDKTQNAVQNTTERAAVAASQSVQNVISNAVRGNRKIGETKSSPMIKERQAANTANRLADTGTADRVADTGRGATSNFKTKDTVTTASPKPTNQHTVKATAHARQASGKAAHPGRTANSREMGNAAPYRNIQGSRSKRFGIRQKGITHKGANTAIKSRKPMIKPIKSAGKASGRAVKTAQHTAVATKNAAVKTAKAAKMAAHAARVSAKAAVLATKVAVKAVIAFVKAAIAAVKGLAAAVAAGGWVAVAVIVIISLIAVIVGSVFGIFFTGEENTHTGVSINSVLAELDGEFNARIDDIILSNPHDELDRSGGRALWRHVLAVYAVRTAADPYNPMDVATVDDERAQLLRDVFWDMNIITYEVYEYEIEVDELDDDGEPTGETYMETIVVLRIIVSAVSVSEISALYGFTAEQQRWLEELLLPEYNALWNTLLFGVSFIGSGTLIEIAESQIGNIGGEIYWRWYGFSSRVPWCAIFVTWVAYQAGYIESGALPRFASVAVGIQWFRDNGLWFDRSYVPSPGDLIFFDWESDGRADHVGFVERVEGAYVHTIEGNSSDSVRRRTYRLDSVRIVGYGVMRHG